MTGSPIRPAWKRRSGGRDVRSSGVSDVWLGEGSLGFPSCKFSAGWEALLPNSYFFLSALIQAVTQLKKSSKVRLLGISQ